MLKVTRAIYRVGSRTYRTCIIQHKSRFSTASKSVKTAVVTGGNRGIGLEICKQLTGSGINVIMTTRKLENGLKALETFKNKSERDGVSLLELDISDTYSISDAIKHIESNHDTIDILINNAGINLCRSNIDSSRKMINQTLKTNYYGTIEFTQALLPLMTTHKTSKCQSLSTFPSRIITISNRDAALNKLSAAYQEKFLDDNLDENGLNALMETFKKDALKHMNQKDDEGDCLMMKEGWLKCPYLMSYVGLNMFCRILGSKFNKDNEHWIAAYCPGHCATEATDHFGTRDREEGAFGATTLSTMFLENDDIPNGKFCAAFYGNDNLESIQLQVMDFLNPSDTVSWDILCDANL